MLKNKTESFPMRASHAVGTQCWRIHVTNYGPLKTTWDFYTRSEGYVEVKSKIILNLSPDAIITSTHGTIEFVPSKG